MSAQNYQWKSLFRRFARNERGSIAMMFGVALLPLMGAAGAAIDYSKASTVRTSALSAADTASLAGAMTTGSATDKENAARKVFLSNMRSISDTTYTPTFETITTSGVITGYRVKVTGNVNTSMMKLIGFSQMPFEVISEAVAPKNENADIAFVLDTTDSMEGDRMISMKAAATSMIDDLQRRQQRSDQFKISVIPFAQYVNIGMSYRNAPWMDVQADYQTPITNSCSFQLPVVGTTNCRMVHYPATPATPATPCVRDGRNRMCPGSPAQPASSANVCDNVMGTTPVNVCTPVGGDWVRWYGCAGSRAYPLETQDANYGTARIPGVMNVTCGSPLLELTSDFATAKANINSLTTSGETYIPSGLVWGWRALSSRDPLTGRTSVPGTPVRKFMILMTDGKNTKSSSYPAHDGTSEANANQITAETCTGIAADTTNGIRIYSVAYEVTDAAVKTLLTRCAEATGGTFFDATGADALKQVFAQIGANISGFRLSR